MPFCSNYQNNSISSPGFLGQRFNNLQKAALLWSFSHHRFNMTKLLMSSVQYDKILSKFGQQQLVMVNYACGFNQSATGKYFGWITNNTNVLLDEVLTEWRPRLIALTETLITCIQTPLYKHPLNTDSSLLWTVCFVPGERTPLHFLQIQPT